MTLREATTASEYGKMFPEPRTLDEALQEYHSRRLTGRSTPCRDKVLAVIDEQRPQQGWSITKAVGFAIGSFTANYKSKYPPYWSASFLRPLERLVIFLDIVEHLQSNGCSNIEIIAQDPAFTDLDNAALEALGVRAVDDPVAQKHVSRDVFTFVPCHWDIESDFLAQCRHLCPSLHIGLATKDNLQDEKMCFGVNAQAWYDEQRANGHPWSQASSPGVRITMLQRYEDEHTLTNFPECDISDCMCKAVTYFALHSEIRSHVTNSESAAKAECAACYGGRRLDYSWRFGYLWFTRKQRYPFRSPEAEALLEVMRSASHYRRVPSIRYTARELWKWLREVL